MILCKRKWATPAMGNLDDVSHPTRAGDHRPFPVPFGEAFLRHARLDDARSCKPAIGTRHRHRRERRDATHLLHRRRIRFLNRTRDWDGHSWEAGFITLTNAVTTVAGQLL